MLAKRPQLQNTEFPSPRRQRTGAFQVNSGFRCNQTGLRGHVNAGQSRLEIMGSPTLSLIPNVLIASGFDPLDLTGGAAELQPHFRRLATATRELLRGDLNGKSIEIADRCFRCTAGQGAAAATPTFVDTI